MFCPNCGRYVPADSPGCEHCGLDFRPKKRLPVDKIAAFAVMIVLGISAVYFMNYETEDADNLVRAALKEMQRGDEILQTVEGELFGAEEVQFESENHTRSELEYVEKMKGDVQCLLPLLEDASSSFERADTFLASCEELRLPGQYHEYVELQLKIVSTRKECCDVLQTVSESYVMYYEFAACYLEGEQLLLTVMTDMNRGNDHLEMKDYQFAFTAYESAIENLTDAEKAYTAAARVIDIPYIDDSLTNMEHLEKALDSLSEAARQLEMGNTENASLLAELGIRELGSLTEVNRLQLKLQVADWFEMYIAEKLRKAQELNLVIKELEDKAEPLKSQEG
ncbi:MAG: zinc ribbon domain-containing protein [Theionarchaea archaeon]|nr:zinc ribbon domain-containing protein [Theionarchaea archaeon]MBU7036637.1 zinc ribbon domain-containing protein [Theionarchaea archaeon]